MFEEEKIYSSKYPDQFSQGVNDGYLAVEVRDAVRAERRAAMRVGGGGGGRRGAQ
jgi:hypothetical protein